MGGDFDRACVRACVLTERGGLGRWAQQRRVFGKPLNAQPVIRAKLAAMISRVEAGQNWLENVTHQMNNVGGGAFGVGVVGADC